MDARFSSIKQSIVEFLDHQDGNMVPYPPERITEMLINLIHPLVEVWQIRRPDGGMLDFHYPSRTGIG